MEKTKTQLRREIEERKAQVSDQRKKIQKLEELNRHAFKRQHEAERRLNALYGTQ